MLLVVLIRLSQQIPGTQNNCNYMIYIIKIECAAHRAAGEVMAVTLTLREGSREQRVEGGFGLLGGDSGVFESFSSLNCPVCPSIDSSPIYLRSDRASGLTVSRSWAQTSPRRTCRVPVTRHPLPTQLAAPRPPRRSPPQLPPTRPIARAGCGAQWWLGSWADSDQPKA